MKPNSLLAGILLIVAIFAVAELGILFHATRSEVTTTLAQASATMEEARLAVADLRAYTSEQVARLRDPRNAKALDAAIQTAAVFNATGRVINAVTLPKAHAVLDGLAESTASLNRMIQATDHSINAKLAPEAARNLQSMSADFSAAAAELSEGLAEFSERANISLDDIHRILSDPSWAAGQAEALSVLAHTDAAMAHAEASLGHVENYLSPKKASFWMKLMGLFIPKFTIKLN